MTVWAWIGVATITFIGLTLVVTLAVARILGAIGHRVSELLDEEAWTSAPLARGADEPASVELPMDDLAAGRTT
jgi:hypothetical protein